MENGSESDSDTEPEPDSDTNTQSDSDSDSEPGSDTDSESDTDAYLEPAWCMRHSSLPVPYWPWLPSPGASTHVHGGESAAPRKERPRPRSSVHAAHVCAHVCAVPPAQ